MSQGKHEGFRLAKGVQYELNAPPGFPTLKTLPHTPYIKMVGVNVFGSGSRKESVVVRCDNVSSIYGEGNEEQVDRAKIRHHEQKKKKEGEEGNNNNNSPLVDPEELAMARSMLGQIVYVDWPYLREARVMGISTQQVIKEK